MGIKLKFDRRIFLGLISLLVISSFFFFLQEYHKQVLQVVIQDENGLEICQVKIVAEVPEVLGARTLGARLSGLMESKYPRCPII